MELADIKKGERKDVILTVRTTKENSKWMKDNNISPTLMFNEAIRDLKKSMKMNVHRTKCVVCGKPSKELKLGLGMETYSFCSDKCMEIYTSKEDSKHNLEVEGTRVYVK